MKSFLIAAVCVIGSSVCFAADETVPPQSSGIAKTEKNYSVYDLEADGTFVETQEIVAQALNDQGVKALNQFRISYSDSLQSIELLDAYTQKSDGRRITVPPANVADRAALQSGGPMYSDLKAKEIIFPDLSVGDRVGLRYKVVQRVPLFPGQFSLAVVYPRVAVYDDVQIRVSAPKDFPEIHTFAQGIDGGPIEDQGGRRQWKWTFRNTQISTPEFGAVAPIDYAPRLIVSTFKDYAAVAAASEARARPKAEVTSKVRALAEDLTKGITEPREQAKALYTWVAHNIRYAGNLIGVGSVVPHEADLVLDNRLGDCKDHTALLQALLAAKGIESTPALVNAGTSYDLPSVASIAVLNHVINYIPSLDVYLDSTSQYVPFGMLPPSEADKPVLHTTNFSGVTRTPPSDFRATTSRMKMTLHVHDDGSADGGVANDETGLASVGPRAVFASLNPTSIDQVGRQILARSGYTGTASFTWTDPQKPTEDYTYSGEFHLNSAINVPGPGAFTVRPVISSEIPIATATAALGFPERKLNFPCVSGILIEDYTIELPKGVKVVTVPKDVHVETEHGQYDSVYQSKGDTLKVVRKLEDRGPRNFCTPKDDKDGRPFLNAILKDLQAQVVYQ